MSQPRQRQLRLGLLNCENLFVYTENWRHQDILRMNEKEWQALTSATTGNKSLSKIKWLADTFKAMDADILLLNEVGGRESLDNFNRHFLRGTHRPYLIEGNSDRGIDIGYLVRQTLPGRFQLRTHRHRPLRFQCPRASTAAAKSLFMSRDISELRWFDVDSSQPKIIFLLVHLKSRLDPQGIDPGGRLRRRAEAECLVELYKELRSQFPTTPFVVAGDFNGQAAGPKPDEEFAAITQTDLQEVFQILNLPMEKSASQVNIARSGYSQLLKIDHVFVSAELQGQISQAGTEVFLFRSDIGIPMPYVASMESRNALPSDHYPLLVTINL